MTCAQWRLIGLICIFIIAVLMLFCGGCTEQDAPKIQPPTLRATGITGTHKIPLNYKDDGTTLLCVRYKDHGYVFVSRYGQAMTQLFESNHEPVRCD